MDTSKATLDTLWLMTRWPLWPLHHALLTSSNEEPGPKCSAAYPQRDQKIQNSLRACSQPNGSEPQWFIFLSISISIHTCHYRNALNLYPYFPIVMSFQDEKHFFLFLFHGMEGLSKVLEGTSCGDQNFIRRSFVRKNAALMSALCKRERQTKSDKN